MLFQPDLDLVGGPARRDRTVVVWRDSDGRKQTLPVADAADVRFEDAKPARSFPQYREQRSFPGLQYMHTVGALVGFESLLERDALLVLDFDPQVVAVSSQPCWFAGGDEDGYWWRCPDFFARRGDGSGLFVDVKPEYLLDDPDVKEGLDRARQVCDRVGWDYEVRTEGHPVYASNVAWLHSYGRDFDDPYGLSQKLLDACQRPTTVEDLLAAVGDEVFARPFLYQHLWYRRLRMDMRTSHLEQHTVISPSPKDYS